MNSEATFLFLASTNLQGTVSLRKLLLTDWCKVLKFFKYVFETRIFDLIFSNVVEKCVTHASRAERAMLIDEVCSSNDRYTS